MVIAAHWSVWAAIRMEASLFLGFIKRLAIFTSIFEHTSSSWPDYLDYSLLYLLCICGCDQLQDKSRFSSGFLC